MNMVEKVARAIAHGQGARITGPSRHRAAEEFGWDPNHNYMQKYIDAHWKEHLIAARFAIEAMRDISGRPEYMVDMWFGAKPHDGFGKAKWQEVIDAALKEVE